jgi:hypothetical protein
MLKAILSWAAATTILMFSSAAIAGQQLLWHEGGHYDSGEIEAEQIVTPRSLATYLGLTADDAVFTPPRQFRTKAFNDDHIEIEPMKAEDADGV